MILVSWLQLSRIAKIHQIEDKLYQKVIKEQTIITITLASNSSNEKVVVDGFFFSASNFKCLYCLTRSKDELQSSTCSFLR
jgi:hypothetical protein